jgi:tRNA nucleotidyltransferase/poly(A) polymerase
MKNLIIDFNHELPDFNIYLVGGFIRDKLLGVESKDLDFVCEAKSFNEMYNWVEKTHKKIFISKPEFLTIRALGFDGKPYDYVLARSDGTYSDGRRPDSVSVGTIFDDISRRDFTVNSMALNVGTGELLDPFDGAADLKAMTLRCVGSTEDRLFEDPLRVIRAIRFCITKGFSPSDEIKRVFEDEIWVDRIISSVSMERIREELTKCFKFDTEATIKFLVLEMNEEYLRLFKETELWLKPTTEKK